jgi:glyoxylase-like metal-dependent hydrolase (beta-lactamase superfamily II)
MSVIEEILTNIYRIEIPLPEDPVRAINSYVLKDSARNLIIDTGLNRGECRDAMKAGLDEIGVQLKDADFFITHLHADHFALVSTLVTDNATVYFNQPDAEGITRGAPWDDMIAYAGANGFPEKELLAALQDHPGYKYGSKIHVPFKILKEDDTIDIGQYHFRCVETPGHTMGHMCLYEPSKRILVSGDHILGDITPNIQSWSDEGNPLLKYLRSLDKVYELDVAVVLPGHRRIFKRCRERIQELKDHHQRRVDEILTILKKGSGTAYQVASGMTWDITWESWDHFPVLQKLFATGEAIAHLQYLREKGMVFRETLGGKLVYSLDESSTT